MNNTFTVNKRAEAIEEIAKKLNECNLLLAFEIEELGNGYLLYLQTDAIELNHKEVGVEGMKKFLIELRSRVANQDDIDDLMEELKYIKFN